MQRAEFEIWKNRSRWSFRELAYLLDGYDPRSTDMTAEMQEKIRAMGNEAHGYYRERGRIAPTHFGNDMDLLDEYHPARSLLVWARDCLGHSIPEELQDIAEESPPESNNQPKPLSTREENTLLLIIKALDKMAKLPERPFEAAKKILEKLELQGQTLSKETIADKLNKARQYTQ